MRLPAGGFNIRIPAAEHVDYLSLRRIKYVITHQAVLPGRQAGAQGGEGGRRRAGKDRTDLPRRVEEAAQEGGMPRPLSQEGRAEAVDEYNADPPGNGQIQCVDEARQAQCGSGAGEYFTDGSAAVRGFCREGFPVKDSACHVWLYRPWCARLKRVARPG
ncbi:hypothetical protein GCM10027403_29320 [Arthrobacter tecti]